MNHNPEGNLGVWIIYVIDDKQKKLPIKHEYEVGQVDYW